MKRGFSIIALAACVLIAAHAEAVVRVMDEGTSYFGNGHNGGRAFSRDASGRLWCAYRYYQTSGLGQIRVAYSDDNGAHWTCNYLTGPDGPLYQAWPPVGTQENPTLLVDGEGLTHTIWSSYSSTTDTGGVHHALHWPGPWDINWFTQREVADYTVEPLYGNSTPAAALDSQGRIHAVWSQKIGAATTKKNVYYAVYSGGKLGSWSEPRQLHPAPQRDQLSPSIAVDPSDNVFVAYYALPDDSDVGEIKLLSGPNLDQLKSVSDSIYSQVTPCIACDPDDNLHVVWLGKDENSVVDHDLYYRRRGADGQWHDVELVNNATSGDHRTPSVATDMNGNVYIISEAWRADESDYGVVLHQKFINDVGWGNARSLAILEDHWFTKDTRMLHSYWPLVNGLPLNIPKAMYAYSFDVNWRDPISGDAGNFSARAGIPDGLTWMGQNYVELRIIPATTGGFTYAAGELLNLEWKVYPDAFAGLETPHDVYFGAWYTPAVDGRSCTLQELADGGGALFLYKGTREGWQPLVPPLPGWKSVAFPLPGDVTSGTMTFALPASPGRWVFFMAMMDPASGAFIAAPEIGCSQYFWIE